MGCLGESHSPKDIKTGFFIEPVETPVIWIKDNIGYKF